MGIAASLFPIESAAAAERGVYAGVSASTGRMAARFDKRLRIDGTVCPGCPKARDVSESGSADDALASVGGLIGYRLPLRGRLFAAIEADAQWNDGEVTGAHRGEGTGYNDLWPETWTLEKRQDGGLTLHLGTRLRPGLDIHALAGFRSIRTFARHANIGCRVATSPCPVAPQPGGTEGGLRYGAWSFGLGIEHAIGTKAAIQVQLRRSDYRRRLWRHYQDGAQTVDSSKDAKEAMLSLRVIRYF